MRVHGGRVAGALYKYPPPCGQTNKTENITFVTRLASGKNDLVVSLTSSSKLLLQTVDMSVNGSCGR